MIEDDFYATLKLKTGEELFAKVAASEEETKTLLIITNPVLVSEINFKNGIGAYKLEPWLKSTKEDMFILNMTDIITISESKDIEMISMYQSYVRKISNSKQNKTTASRKMGYLSNVNDAKELLEKLYKNS